MTLRPPHANTKARTESALGYEIAQEQAAALGRLGRALEAALAALSQHDRGDTDYDGSANPAPSAGPTRELLVQRASDALWCFVVQREACGLGDQKTVVRQYGVPAELQNRMGVFATTAR